MIINDFKQFLREARQNLIGFWEILSCNSVTIFHYIIKATDFSFISLLVNSFFKTKQFYVNNVTSYNINMNLLHNFKLKVTKQCNEVKNHIKIMNYIAAKASDSQGIRS